MNDALGMACGERLKHLPKQLRRLWGRDTLPLQELLQRRALHKLHLNRQPLVPVMHGVYTDDIGVLDLRGEEAMGAIEIVDRKRHEYHCGSCMMALPMETVNGLLSSGRLTRCSSCQCIMYLTREDEERLRTTKK